MDGLRFKQTVMSRVIEAGLETLIVPDGRTVRTINRLDDQNVWIDHDLIKAVIHDLVRNALESIKSTGEVTIETEGDEKTVAIIIKDTGVGIKKEDVPFLLTPFFTTKPVGDGTGLGLPSAYATVRAHSGNLHIESYADPASGPTGTTVTITLPRRQAFQQKESKIILHGEE